MTATAPAIGIIYSFGRSGSTLLNQCLGCHPTNAVLSEVNPAGSFLDVAWQASHWLGLASAPEAVSLGQLSYDAQIRMLAERSMANGRRLILRDWTTLNFLRNARPGIEPSSVLEQEWYLGEMPLELRRVVFCRRAQAVYDSCRRSFPQYRNLTPEEFGTAYLAYAKAVSSYPIVHLEEFTRQPEKEFKRVCGLLGAAYADDFPGRFFSYQNCTGNTTLSAESTSAQLHRIVEVAAPRGPADSALFLTADKLLGYEPR